MALICWPITALLLLIVARVILSFIPTEDGGVFGSIATLIYNITEPILATVRRFMPQIGDIPIDFSPTIVLFVLFFLRGLLHC